MTTLNREDIKDMSDGQRERYCYWCWFHDYGNCDKCALLYKNTPSIKDKLIIDIKNIK